MSKIDSRIVELKFNTSDFERGVKRTQQNMQQLDAALNLDGVAKGVDTIASKFNPLGAIAFSALQRLTNSAIDFGLKIGNAITEPLIQGGRRRAMSIEQAKFQFQGLGMDVEQAMDDALYAVKGTAFGLDEAAMAASMFGASGVQSGEEMKQALRGISGVAAMSGSSYTDMANVFTKVAGQGRLMGDDLNRLGTRGINAAATLADYFNKTGEVVGATEADIREMVTKGEIDFNTFAMAMSDAFGEHATKASETFTGALANMNAALARIGEMGWAPHLERMRNLYNSLTPIIDGVAHAIQPLIEGFSDLVDISFDNLVNFLDNLGFSDLTDDFTPPIIEGLMSIFDTILSVVEPIHQAWLDVFPPMAAENVRNIGEAVKSFADAIKPTDATLKNLQSTFRGLFAIVGIGWEVFKAVLSGVFEFIGVLMGGTGSVLEFTGSIGDMVYSFYDAIRSGDGLSNFFRGLGRIIAKPIEFIMHLVGGLGGLFSAIGSGLGIAGQFIAALFGIGEEAGSTSTIAERFAGVMEGLGGVGERLGEIWDGIVNVFKAVGDFLAPLFATISGAASALFDPLIEAFQSQGLQGILDIVNTGVLAMVGKAIYDFFQSITDVSDDSGGIVEGIKEIFGGVTDSLETLQTTLKANTLITIAGAIALLAGSVFLLSTIDGASLAKALTGMTVMFGQLVGSLFLFQKILSGGGLFQLPIVAAGLLILSGAMVLLSVAVKNLSDLDWNGLLKGLTGVVGMLGAVAGFMHIMPKNPTGLISTGIGMMAIAGGLILLSSAVRRFADMSWADLSKGMAGVASGLLLMAGAMRLMPAKGMILSGTGLVIVAAALNILAEAVQKFSSMSWEEIGRGLTVMAGALVAIAGALRLMPKNLILTGAGLAIVAASVGILADAMQSFGSIPWDAIGRGLVGLAGSLIVIAGAMRLMPGNMILTATGLVIVGEALKSISGVLSSMGGMSWEEIGKGLVTLAGSLVILAGGLHLMSGTLMGSASLVIAAGALTALTPVLQSLGGMSWEEIGKGLVMLAGSLVVLAGGMYLMSAALPGAAALVVVAGALSILTPVLLALGGMTWSEIGIGLTALAGSLAVLGVAGLLIGPLVPALLGLGAAIALIGAGAALAGVGMLTFASGLATIVGLGAGGIAVLTAALSAIIDMIPRLLTSIAAGLAGAVAALAAGASEIMASVKILILEFITTLGEIIPEIVQFGVDIITAFIEGAREVVPNLIELGTEVVMGFLEGLEQVVPQLLETGATIITSFLETIESNIPQWSETGANILVSLIEGFTKNMKSIGAAVTLMITTFLVEIANNMSKITQAATYVIVSFIKGLTDSVDKISEAVTELVTTFLGAIEDHITEVIDAGVDIIVALIEGIGDGAKDIATAAGEAVTEFIEEVDKQTQNIIDAGTNLIVNFINGVGEGSVEIAVAVSNMIQDFLGALEEEIPNIVTAGANFLIAVLNGFEREIPRVATSVVNLIEVLGQEVVKNTERLANIGFDVVIGILRGIRQTIEVRAPELQTEAMLLGRAIIDGIAPGMRERITGLWESIQEIGRNIIDWFKGILGIQSPSTKTMQMGRDLIDGFIAGLGEKLGELGETIRGIGESIVKWFGEKLGIGGEGGGSSKTRPIGNALITGLLSGITGGRPLLGTTILGIGTSTLGWFSSRLGISGNTSKPTQGYGSALVGGIGFGVNRGTSGMLRTIGNTTGSAIRNFVSNLGIRGGSSVTTQGHGSALMGGLGSGINRGSRGVLASATSVSRNTISRFRGQLTSGKTQPFGTATTRGIQTGVSRGWGGLGRTISTVARNAISRFRGRFTSSTLVSSGRQLVSGLTNGIRNSWSRLSGAISNIARNAIARFKNAFQIRSPSRVLMEVGDFVGQGLALGIEGSEDRVAKASDRTANSAVDAMRNSLKRIQDVLDSEMDASPVIRPILDMSEVEKGYRDLNTIMPPHAMKAFTSKGQAEALAAMARVVRGGSTDPEDVRPAVQYIQTITSPKPLTEKDIYRQTKGLIRSGFGDVE